MEMEKREGTGNLTGNLLFFIRSAAENLGLLLSFPALFGCLLLLL